MRELFIRLKSYPSVTAELAAASLFANLLALASPLFVIQVLNRYVSHGVDSTLFTLTAGVLIAIAFEVAFRQIRLTIANALSQPFDRANAEAAYEILSQARADVMARMSAGQKRQVASAVDSIQQAYAAPSMVAYLDLPFALVFLLALSMLSLPLAGVALFFIVLVIVLGWFNLGAMKAPTEAMQNQMGVRQGLLDSVIMDVDTVRAFNGGSFLMKRWRQVQDGLADIRSTISARQGRSQNFTQGIQALMSTAVIATGAMLVVSGNLDVGLLIGANILAARTLAPIIRVTQTASVIASANTARTTLENFLKLPCEPRQGSALGNYKGGVEFKDVAFMYAGQPTPLFESLNLRLEPGALFVVAGANGAGKTTLSRLLAGLISPSRGQILVDGVDLAQVAPEWWRRQIIYLPQEPSFIAGTVRENIMAFNPNMSEADLNSVIRDAGLEKFFAASREGFDMNLRGGGTNLPVGIRRRLALARALAVDGRLVILDEPLEGMDSEGMQQIGQLMNALSKKGCTIIALSHDPKIIKGAVNILDLNVKPVPRVLLAQEQTGANTPAKATQAKQKEGA